MKEFFKVLYTKSAKDYCIKLSKYLDNRTRKFIVTANPETFMMAKTDEVMRDILLDSDNDIIPDGIAVVKSAGFYGNRPVERITGVDTAATLLELLNNKKKTLYLFGSKREVLDALVEKINREYPCIKILGAVDGYVEDKDAVFEKIVEASPDVCLVALGIPEQEKLIAKHIGKVQKGIYMGVGGTFDVMSGKKRRAPKLFIKLNLEWLYRLMKEPRRIKRFWNNNVKFVFEAFVDRKK